MNTKRIARRIVGQGTKEYRLTDRRSIHALLDILLDDGAIFRVSGNGGGANITVQFHSDERMNAVDDLLSGMVPDSRRVAGPGAGRRRGARSRP